MMCPDCKDGDTVQLNVVDNVMEVQRVWRGLINIHEIEVYRCPFCKKVYYRITNVLEGREI